MRTAQRIGDHLDIGEIAASEDKPQHIWAKMDFVADDLGVEIVNQETRSDHSYFAMVQRRHLIAEMSHVAKPVAVGRH